MHAITTLVHWSLTQNRIGVASPSDISSHVVPPTQIKLHDSDHPPSPLQRKGEACGRSIEAKIISQMVDLLSFGVIDCEEIRRLTDSSSTSRVLNFSTLGPKTSSSQSQSQPSLLRTGPSHLTAHPSSAIQYSKSLPPNKSLVTCPLRSKLFHLLQFPTQKQNNPLHPHPQNTASPLPPPNSNKPSPRNDEQSQIPPTSRNTRHSHPSK
jgi:hypothetical protein